MSWSKEHGFDAQPAI